MQNKKLCLGLAVVLALFAAVTFLATRAVAQTERVLYSFDDNGEDAAGPNSTLAFDKMGNVYGTTRVGGLYNEGAVFELTLKVDGSWRERVLHSFNNNGKDGFEPYGGLVIDSSGNLYGTTYSGGAYGYGTVFELIPQAGGGWPEEILHNFGNSGTDGEYPFGSLIFSAAGNLYGTTVLAAGEGLGTVFELKHLPDGHWGEKTLLRFTGNGTGEVPYAGLVFDAAGNLYGTTSTGGSQNAGAVFELSPASDGTWTESLLHSFADNGTDGYDPVAGLIFDLSGNLYGTTYLGGTYDSGTAFELSPVGDGSWNESVVYDFAGGSDGAFPNYGSLIFDSTGNLYGMTVTGGANGVGAAYELSPAVGGGWTKTILHSFGSAGDGLGPFAGLIFGASGKLYGTTQVGGNSFDGTVFEITP
jgi:uncharacterized repeat protein (TIGR03803 family)